MVKAELLKFLLTTEAGREDLNYALIFHWFPKPFNF